MAVPAQRGDDFRALHVRGTPLVLFNVWDAGSARAVAAAGARAVATSSWAVAAAHGVADGEQLPLAAAMETVRRIVAVTDLPVTVDLESGYGDAPERVGDAVLLAIEAGAVGCNLEDSFPADGRLREVGEHARRIGRARQVADGTATRVFINARTDVFFQRPPDRHDQTMVVEAVARACAYADAGADGLFAPGLSDLGLIARLVEASPLPVNVMVDDRTPPLAALAQRGVARVSHGPRPYYAAMTALEAAARAAGAG